MSYSWHDLVGNIGVVIILVVYLLLQMDRLATRSASFSLLNGVGALLILVSLSQEFNLSAFIIEFFWLIVSVYGLIKTLTLQRNSRDEPA